jgi:hypothetical protein
MVFRQLGRLPLERDCAVNKHVNLVHNGQYGLGVVFHHDHRDLSAQLDERLHHLIDHRRG